MSFNLKFSFSQIVHLLLITCIPISIIVYYTTKETYASFSLALAGLVPLCIWIGNAAEELGELSDNVVIAGLLAATFGNITELIFGIIAIKKKLYSLMLSVILGSPVSNCLLVFGSSLMTGGFKNNIQYYTENTICNLSFTNLSAVGYIFIVPFIISILQKEYAYPSTDTASQHMTLLISIVLIVSYLPIMYFQIQNTQQPETSNVDSNSSTPFVVSNDDMELSLQLVKPPPLPIQPEEAQTPKSTDAVKSRSFNDHHLKKLDLENPASSQPISLSSNVLLTVMNKKSQCRCQLQLTNLDYIYTIGNNTTVTQHNVTTQQETDDVEIQSQSSMSQIMTQDAKRKQLIQNIIILAICSALVGILSDIITATVVPLIAGSPTITEEFIGFIVIAITGNAAEHWTSVSTSYKNKPDLSAATVYGSCLQIVMLLTPIFVFVSYTNEIPFNLVFEPLQLFMFNITNLVSWKVISDGKTNWAEGMLLVALYAIWIGITLMAY